MWSEFILIWNEFILFWNDFIPDRNYGIGMNSFQSGTHSFRSGIYSFLFNFSHSVSAGCVLTWGWALVQLWAGLVAALHQLPAPRQRLLRAARVPGPGTRGAELVELSTTILYTIDYRNTSDLSNENSKYWWGVSLHSPDRGASHVEILTSWTCVWNTICKYWD